MPHTSKDTLPQRPSPLASSTQMSNVVDVNIQGLKVGRSCQIQHGRGLQVSQFHGCHSGPGGCYRTLCGTLTEEQRTRESISNAAQASSTPSSCAKKCLPRLTPQLSAISTQRCSLKRSPPTIDRKLLAGQGCNRRTLRMAGFHLLHR